MLILKNATIAEFESWPVEQQKNVMLGGGDNALTLPEQASNIRLQSSETPQEIFRNNLDALVDEPWGGGTLSPIRRMVSAFGPMKIKPERSTCSAKLAFSERKP